MDADLYHIYNLLHRDSEVSAILCFREWASLRPGNYTANRVYYFTWVMCGCPMTGDHRWGENAFWRKNGRNCQNTDRANALYLALDELLNASNVSADITPSQQTINGVSQSGFRWQCGNSSQSIGPKVCIKQFTSCAVCLEEETANNVAFCQGCGNGMHDSCIQNWFCKSKTIGCPNCRHCFLCGEESHH